MSNGRRSRTIRSLLRSRPLSAAVALAYLLCVYVATNELEAVVYTLAFLLLPLVCIWYPDEMGRLTGISMGIGRPVIMQPTPGDFVAFGGWVLIAASVATSYATYTTTTF